MNYERKDDVLVEQLVKAVDNLHAKVDNNAQKQEELQKAVSAVAARVEEIDQKTSGLVEAWQALDGAGKVVAWLAKVAKTLASLAIFGTIGAWVIKKLGG